MVNFNKISTVWSIAFIVLLSVMFLNGCKKDPLPENPYDSVNYNPNPNNPSNPDPTSITGLHKNIFSLKCATPGCHDGSFEPDYRTVQSTYSTLVYQPVIKNNPSGSFIYRVIPYDTSGSWLHERLITNDPVLGQMPLYSTPLSQAEMNNINAWIMNGARDANNQVAALPALPNDPPVVVGYVAFDSNNNRIDTNRVDGISFNPFIVPSNSMVTLYFLITDDSTSAANLLVNQLRLSTSINDFTGAQIINASFVQIGALQLWGLQVNTGSFATGANVYMRYHVNDGSHPFNMEYPNNNTLTYLKTLYSFYIQP